jgi:acylphosphatase
MTSERVCTRISVHGRVQGVGYRAWLARTAHAKEVDGFVRNRADGSVEALIVGSPEAVESILEAARQGPRGSIVESVHHERADDALLAERPSAGGFVVLPTL